MVSSSSPTDQPHASTYDSILLGTSLTSTILANYYSRIGQRVLQIDCNSYYGSYNATFNLNEYIDLCDCEPVSSNTTTTTSTHTTAIDSPYHSIQCIVPTNNPNYQPRYSKFNTIHNALDDSIKSQSRYFSIDIDGTSTYIYSRSPLVDSMIDTNISQYMEYQTIDIINVYGGSAAYTSTHWRCVPSDKSSVFTSSELCSTDKYELMKLIGIVTNNTDKYKYDIDQLSNDNLISIPFIQYLQQYRHMSAKLCDYVLYALALINTAQVSNITTSDGLQRISIYLQSMNRYGNTNSALLYPIYGIAELTQSYARNSAVHNATYMLQQRIHHIVTDTNTQQAIGVKLQSGEILYSNNIISESSYIIDNQGADNNDQLLNCICIIDQPIIHTNHNHTKTSPSLYIIPPNTQPFNNSVSIQIQQLSNNTQSTPSNLYLLHCTCIHNDTATHDILNMLDILFSKTSAIDRPTLLYASNYLQQLQSTSLNTQLPSNLHIIEYNISIDDSYRMAKQLFTNTISHVTFDDVLQSSDASDATHTNNAIYPIVQPSVDALDELDSILQ